LGRSSGRPELVALGAAGALFHVWNHGLFKSLLFLGAGSTVHATGTREMDRLGGLAKRMPATALLFLIGAAAICGLPPLNGFCSELLVYLGLFGSAVRGQGSLWLAGALAAPGLALIGALAVACFAKAFGVVFLGTERSPAAARAHESGPTMLAPMGVLAGLCVLLGVAPALAAPLLDRAAGSWAGAGLAPVGTLAPLAAVSAAGLALLVLLATGGLWLYLRTRPLLAAAPAPLPTWDCGYATSTPRIQYTASSFADSLVELFRWALRPRVEAPELVGAFPSTTGFHSETPDAVLDLALAPAVDATGRAFNWLHWLQGGSVQAYLFYILATLVVLLLWR
jgi:NADH:ubiquinone oxidoreductase subunit 5 (subunit L)/multisubunit Na+/H+ antiporter MnhA subunit